MDKLEHKNKAVHFFNTARKISRGNKPGIILITDRKRQADTIKLIQSLPKGSAVLLRDYDHPARLSYAKELSTICQTRRLKLIIAADTYIASQVKAEGIHFPERHINKIGRWKRHKPGWLVSCSAHSLPALKRAEAQGADIIIVSSVFFTESHPTTPLGLLRARNITNNTTASVFLLGGINPCNIKCLLGIPRAGIAFVGALE